MNAPARMNGTILPVRLLRAARRWLADVPIADVVDRRNAPMLQIVLLVVGVVPPLLWFYRIVLSDLAWRADETASLAMSLVISAVAITSFALIRRGRFQWATRQLLVVVAVLVITAYVQTGFDRQGYEQPIQVVWLVLAGLVVGRKALWMMYAVYLVAFAAGVWVDVHAPGPSRFSVGDRIGAGVIGGVLFLLIAIVIDRSVAALRAALRDATRRGDELARTNARLNDEIAERERVTEQLIHARKVEAVGHLASGVAHDFNHLLALVAGYAHRGMRSETLDEAKRALTGIDSAARRAMAVAQTLLSFSRRDAARIETLDVNEALAEMRPMLAQLFDAGVHVDIEPATAPANVRFDRNQFALLVLNIATNAQHAMPEGGRFRITVDADEADRVSITLADSGHGMSDEVRQRIFEPFFTTKPAGQGTGLGLAVVAELLAAAGGRIDVLSRPDHGTSLRIDLPRVP